MAPTFHQFQFPLIPSIRIFPTCSNASTKTQGGEGVVLCDFEAMHDVWEPGPARPTPAVGLLLETVGSFLSKCWWKQLGPQYGRWWCWFRGLECTGRIGWPGESYQHFRQWNRPIVVWGYIGDSYYTVKWGIMINHYILIKIYIRNLIKQPVKWEVRVFLLVAHLVLFLFHQDEGHWKAIQFFHPEEHGSPSFGEDDWFRLSKGPWIQVPCRSFCGVYSVGCWPWRCGCWPCRSELLVAFWWTQRPFCLCACHCGRGYVVGFCDVLVAC